MPRMSQTSVSSPLLLGRWRPINWPPWKLDPVPSPTPGPAPPVIGMAADLLSAHNRIRTMRGLRAFQAAPELMRSAQGWADKMTIVGMTHGDFSSRISAQGYRWRSAAENIAAGQQTVDEVMRSWQDPGHFANIIGPYADVGFGVSRTVNGALYWCVDFGSR